MRADYTEYTERYNYMSNVLRQIQGVQRGSNPCICLGMGNIQNGLSFADTFSNAASSVKVPESMDAIFEEAAEKYDVPVNLLKAMGKAESGFDANAVSLAGAKGVMQLMPGTAKSLGVADPFDARSNIMGGAKYISQKLKKYEGNIDLALAAYNAGSGNVKKYGGVPPFKETQNYIRKIRKYMGMDIKTDQTVYSEKTEYKNQQGIYRQQDALYFVELMKLQMQSRMALSSQNVFGNGMDYI